MGIIKEYLLNNPDENTEDLIYLWADRYELELLWWEEYKKQEGRVHIELPINQPHEHYSDLPF